ncbi:hypothetical protein TVAG_024210 [Trichomonas vaginalis G3]|uniref:IPT/TIG domain-containing protein n=1 Tax=Trichomonas vaginalis (strain ATCC PRA-98 / G3) TaxID=412133 RepID=A2FM79_TRIV3|nr:immunoglobulins domain-containing protein [Trichomonas vaginalis G3]EAX93977.1 hypothetical protein TVAG_024210 [Trichomonas vaginalis G3]KAI5510307.1 immunoglobulins domain-containing protein [Trichomonas vaginalis G3]|eukprot:XP_001306907.1 hypothetical protein [Trichomonas vaginalis G3]
MLIFLFSLISSFEIKRIGIKDIKPSEGPTEGGTVVTVSLNTSVQYLQVYCRFNFNTVIEKIEKDTITCVTPKHDAGKVQLRISFDNNDYDDIPYTEFTYFIPDSVKRKSRMAFVFVLITLIIVVVLTLVLLFKSPMSRVNPEEDAPLLNSHKNPL